MSDDAPGWGDRPDRGDAQPRGDYEEIGQGLGRRLRVPALFRGRERTPVLGLFALVNGFLSIGLMAAAAHVTGQPLVFPSLGPTAFLLFYAATQPAASPRNTIFGHLIGAGAGYVSLLAFGLAAAGPALATHHVTWFRVGAVALSLGLTAGLMVWLGIPHPPAGATTMIVSLGIIRTPAHIGVLMAAVAALVVQGIVINRWLAGIDYPFWSPRS